MREVNFEFNVGSDVDFDDLIADIGFDDKLVAILTQEEGPEKIRIRLYPPKDSAYWDFPLTELMKIIHNAKNCLLQLRKVE